jgi:hypothetical protein
MLHAGFRNIRTNLPHLTPPCCDARRSFSNTCLFTDDAPYATAACRSGAAASRTPRAFASLSPSPSPVGSPSPSPLLSFTSLPRACTLPATAAVRDGGRSPAPSAELPSKGSLPAGSDSAVAALHTHLQRRLSRAQGEAPGPYLT